MAGVVGNKEANDFFILATLLLDVGEFEAVVFLSVLSLHGGLSLINEARLYEFGEAGDVDIHRFSLLPSRRIIVAGTEEYVEHIVNAVVVCLFLICHLAAVVPVSLRYGALSVGIRVDNLIGIVALSLVRRLTIVERRHALAGIYEQGIAHTEHLIDG